MCCVQVDMIEQTGKQAILHHIEGRRFGFFFVFVISQLTI